MVRSAVHVPFYFVKKSGSEGMFQGHHVVGRVIDGLQLVSGKTTAVGGVYQADVALSTTVEQRLVVKLVIEPNQPGVLMNSSGRSGREQIGVGIDRRGLLECRIRINELGGTAIDGACRVPPGISSHDPAHLWGGVQHLLLEGRTTSRRCDAGWY